MDICITQRLVVCDFFASHFQILSIEDDGAYEIHFIGFNASNDLIVEKQDVFPLTDHNKHIQASLRHTAKKNAAQKQAKKIKQTKETRSPKSPSDRVEKKEHQRKEAVEPGKEKHQERTVQSLSPPTANTRSQWRKQLQSLFSQTQLQSSKSKSEQNPTVTTKRTASDQHNNDVAPVKRKRGRPAKVKQQGKEQPEAKQAKVDEDSQKSQAASKLTDGGTVKPVGPSVANIETQQVKNETTRRTNNGKVSEHKDRPIVEIKVTKHQEATKPSPSPSAAATPPTSNSKEFETNPNDHNTTMLESQHKPKRCASSIAAAIIASGKLKKINPASTKQTSQTSTVQGVIMSHVVFGQYPIT